MEGPRHTVTGSVGGIRGMAGGLQCEDVLGGEGKGWKYRTASAGGPPIFFGPAEKKRKTMVVTAKRDYSRDEMVNPNKILNLDLKSKTTASQKAGLL